MRNVFLVIATLLVSFSCSQQETGPVEVKWDRDGCDRCRMVLSDRYHAAQVRSGEEGKKNKVFKFDDLGCAIIWLQDKPWKDKAEIWVNDYKTGEWLDARKANYITGQITPMEFGLGAKATATEDSMDFSRVESYILEREARFNQPDSDLKGQANEHQHHH